MQYSDKVNIFSIAFENTKTFINSHIREDIRNDSNIFNKYLNDNINRLLGINIVDTNTIVPTIKKYSKYKNTPFTVPQKMAPIHAFYCMDSMKEIYEPLPMKYDKTNNSHKSILHFSEYLSKKYSHNVYSYREYFFNKLLSHENKFNNAKYRQFVKYTEFNIKTVNIETANILNEMVNTYVSMHSDMNKKRLEYMLSKKALDSIESVKKYKHFVNLVTEYQKDISDIDFKIATYENTNIEYQNVLKESLYYLLIDALDNKKVTELIMLQDIKYKVLSDKATILKSIYKQSLQALIDYRKNFKDYKIYQKVAGYTYTKDGKTMINGIRWSLKTPTGKLNSKTTLSSLQKAYNKVTFDKTSLSLKIHMGL